MSKEQFTITVVSLPSDVPDVNRLRRFLKMALRAYKLRCVEIRENPALVPLRHEQTPETAEKQEMSRNPAAFSDALSTK